MLKEDLINKIFGIYKVLKYDEKTSKEKKRTFWVCECQKCKNIRSVRADLLKREPNSCPECKYPNLIGKTFGRLTVIEKGKIDKNGHRYWVCKCECGNIKEISGSSLIANKTLSCGCLHSELTSQNKFIDISNQTFGFLTTIKRVGKIGETVKYLCKCNNCGNTIIVDKNNLISGHTISCGCLKSKGEFLIRQFLLKNNISFQTEYIFKELPKRRFDFAILNDKKEVQYLIEFDGKQHFNYINTWHKTEEEFIKAKNRDKQKDDWCKKMNIKLYRINYKDNIEEKLNQIFNTAEAPDIEEAESYNTEEVENV